MCVKGPGTIKDAEGAQHTGPPCIKGHGGPTPDEEGANIRSAKLMDEVGTAIRSRCIKGVQAPKVAS